MMKRLIIAILCVAFLALTACGNKSTSSTTESQPVSDVSGTTQDIKGTETPDNNTSENRTVVGEESSEENVKGTEGTTEKAKEKMMITITAGNHVITATLYDNAAGRALWDKLPLTLPMMNLYDREMCYRFGAGGLPEDDAADTGYEIGDISYWPPAGSLVILYKQNGEVFEQQPIGHTDDDISFFEDMPDTDIVFEKVDNEVDNAADNED